MRTEYARLEQAECISAKSFNQSAINLAINEFKWSDFMHHQKGYITCHKSSRKVFNPKTLKMKFSLCRIFFFK